jgi:hypothetical protein
MADERAVGRDGSMMWWYPTEPVKICVVRSVLRGRIA